MLEVWLSAGTSSLPPDCTSSSVLQLTIIQKHRVKPLDGMIGPSEILAGDTYEDLSEDDTFL